MAAENISAKKVVSISSLSRMSFLSQVTFESPQFTNLDNSINIADRIGELYVVDSYICIFRFGMLLRQMRNKVLPLRSKMDTGSLYRTRNIN